MRQVRPSGAEVPGGAGGAGAERGVQTGTRRRFVQARRWGRGGARGRRLIPALRQRCGRFPGAAGPRRRRRWRGESAAGDLKHWPEDGLSAEERGFRDALSRIQSAAGVIQSGFSAPCRRTSIKARRFSIVMAGNRWRRVIRHRRQDSASALVAEAQPAYPAERSIAHQSPSTQCATPPRLPELV